MRLPSLLQRKQTHFVLWRPAQAQPAPQLVIGVFRAGDAARLADERTLTLAQSPEFPDLWERRATDCALREGQVYHYFFEVTDSDPNLGNGRRIRCTDPTAWTVDWRVLSPRLDPPYGDDDRSPAAVVLYEGGQLKPCDPVGPLPTLEEPTALHTLPPNNCLVIYELPTRWTKASNGGVAEGTGTFRDAVALIDETRAPGAFFASVDALGVGTSHLQQLGVNAVELLPPADSFTDRGWGYATSNYFAADYDLGRPHGQDAPTATQDLVDLIQTCHQRGMRFFYDAVMAFSNRDAYRHINFLDFHVRFNHHDPEQAGRDAFGGDLFKYNYSVDGYDPVSGTRQTVVPARQLMKAHIARWMFDFHIDGLRLDSVNNVMNYDFLQEVKDAARAWWQARWEAQGNGADGGDARFLVVGEDLSVPIVLLGQNRLDALWNERFKQILRRVILGRNADGNPSFEWSVRTLIDCRLLGFTDGTQAVNYVTSHDVEGYANERLYNYLLNNGIVYTEARIKLAFVCLLTALGIPMILAGDEFADQHDRMPVYPQKETDPVNYDRLRDPWRRRIFEYVSRLVALRTTSDALAVNDTQFIHVDFTEGKRVVVWQRGRPGVDQPVVVVANFSDWATPNPTAPYAEYVVPNWPPAPHGRRWREVTQDRAVPPECVGREPLYPWEAKVYALE